MSPATVYGSAVVPSIPPEPPQLSLLRSALRPDLSDTDPASSAPPADALSDLPQRLRDELAARRGDVWTRGITWAPENHTEAEVRDACDNSSWDAPALPAPEGLAATEEAGKGSIAAGKALEYKVTATNANGETQALAAVKVTQAAEGAQRLKWARDPDASSFNVYRKDGAGGWYRHATVAGGTYEFQDKAAEAKVGAAAEATPPATNTTGGVGHYTNAPIGVAVPWLIMVNDSCATFGFSERDFQGRALRLLENATPKALEREWWTGQLAQAKGYPNNYLTNSATVTNVTPGTVPSAKRGLQLLQQALDECGFGGRGMIHVQSVTLPNLLYTRRVGNLTLDNKDNIVVPGVGYPGTGPGGSAAPTGEAWMYATDLVSVRIEREGTIFAESFAEAMDWGQGDEPNTIRFTAQRFGVAYADMACHFACKVKLEE